MKKVIAKRNPVNYEPARILNVAFPKVPEPRVAYVLFWADGAEHEGVVFRQSDADAFDAALAAQRGATVRIAGVEQAKPPSFRQPGGAEVQVVIRELLIIT